MRARNWWKLAVVVGMVLGCLPAVAQDQFLSEIDSYTKVRDGIRLQFQAKQTREGGEPVQAEFGPSVEIYTRPLIRSRKVTRFDLDDSKSRLLVMAVGYRYLPQANGAAPTNRMEPVATARFPVTAKILLTDRNRFDLDWTSGGFMWQYRNRFQVEGPVAIGSYHATPYVSVETFYQSKYGKLSETAIYAGCIFPIRRHFQIDPYYEFQNQTGKQPNERLNQMGLVLNLFF
jgi:Protein of unknown function (DUF2490)